MYIRRSKVLITLGSYGAAVSRPVKEKDKKGENRRINCREYINFQFNIAHKILLTLIDVLHSCALHPHKIEF